MVIWPDPKPCTNCGLMQEGHTRKNCPHIECIRCHEHGHMSYDCPNTECSYCHKMGHCKSKCRKLKRKNRGQQGDRAYERPSLPSSVHSSMPPSRRVEPSQSTVDPQPILPLQTTQETTMNSWELVPSVVFLNLHNTICQLTSRLATDPNIYLQRLPYHSVITSHGGPQKIAQMLLEWVDPHIRALEGRFLRTEDLLSVQKRQNNCWSPN